MSLQFVYMLAWALLFNTTNNTLSAHDRHTTEKYLYFDSSWQAELRQKNKGQTQTGSPFLVEGKGSILNSFLS